MTVKAPSEIFLPCPTCGAGPMQQCSDIATRERLAHFHDDRRTSGG